MNAARDVYQSLEQQIYIVYSTLTIHAPLAAHNSPAPLSAVYILYIQRVLPLLLLAIH